MATAFDVALDYIEKARQYQRDYYAKNREKKRHYQKDYYRRHKVEINGKKRAVTRKNAIRGWNGLTKEEYNKRHYREVMAEKVLRTRIKALQIVSGNRKPECVGCGEKDLFVLVINHKNGGGRKEVKNNPFGWWKRILSGERTVEDLDVRCCNCNSRYEYEVGRRHLPRNWSLVIEEETG